MQSGRGRLPRGRVVFYAVAYLALVVLMFMLWGNPRHKYFGEYRRPRCEDCMVGFEDEVCGRCGKSVAETGVFIPYGNGESIRFADVFSSYDEYKAEWFGVLAESCGVLLDLVIVVGVYVWWRAGKRR